MCCCGHLPSVVQAAQSAGPTGGTPESTCGLRRQRPAPLVRYARRVSRFPQRFLPRPGRQRRACEGRGPAHRRNPYRGPVVVPALFKPEMVQRAYGDNVHLYRSVLTLSMEIGSTDFKLRRPLASYDVEYVTRHQALETIRTPHPIEGGKRLLTGMHLMRNGEAFSLLMRRLKANGQAGRGGAADAQCVWVSGPDPHARSVTRRSSSRPSTPSPLPRPATSGPAASRRSASSSSGRRPGTCPRG